MPPVMPPVIIIVVIGIIVVAIIVSRVVRVTRIVIAVVIGSVVPRTAAKRDTESLCLRIVLADRQQSQDRQCDDEKSFHGCTSLILDGSTAAHIRQSAERAVAESLKFAPAIGASGIVYICASRALETMNTAAALCHVKRVKPSGLHSSLPTPWWTIKRPMGSYFVFTAFNFG